LRTGAGTGLAAGAGTGLAAGAGAGLAAGAGAGLAAGTRTGLTATAGRGRLAGRRTTCGRYILNPDIVFPGSCTIFCKRVGPIRIISRGIVNSFACRGSIIVIHISISRTR